MLDVMKNSGNWHFGSLHDSSGQGSFLFPDRERAEAFLKAAEQYPADPQAFEKAAQELAERRDDGLYHKGEKYTVGEEKTTLEILSPRSLRGDYEVSVDGHKGIFKESQLQKILNPETKPERPAETTSETSETSPDSLPFDRGSRYDRDTRTDAQRRADAVVYDAGKALLESAGIKVHEVSGKEAQAMLRHEKTPVAGQPNRANEKLTSGSVLLSAKGDSSSNANVPSEAVAKLAKNTQKAKNNIRKFKNGDAKMDLSSVNNAFKSIGSLFSMRNNGGSRYTILRADNGDTVAIRLADHPANGNNFRKDNADKNLSIVIERKRFNTPDSEIEFTEAIISEATFNADPRKAVDAIVKGVESVLAGGEFELDSSIGTVKPMGGKHETPKFSIETYHGTHADFDAFSHDHVGEGEGNQAFGWGTYVSESEGVGRYYAKGISKRNGEQRLSVNGREVDCDGFTNPWRLVRDLFVDCNGRLREMRERAERYAEFAEEDSPMHDVWPQVVEILKNHKRGDIKALKPQAHLYTVEIPDDTGNNYLDWESSTPKEMLDKIKAALAERGVNSEMLAEMDGGSGRATYRTVARYCGSYKAASELLSSLGITGIRYLTESLSGGNRTGEHNYVIFNDADLKITDHARFLRDSRGVVYGWASGGEVFLNRDAMNPETPLHEYTHLWDTMVQRENPELWSRGKELLRQTALWRQVIEDAAYADIRDNEDAVASEVHSRLTGRDGAKLIEQMTKEAASESDIIGKAAKFRLIHYLKSWLYDMFKGLKNTLSKWSGRDLKNLTLDDFNRLTLRDLAEGINPRSRDRNLVAVHNLSEENLADALDLGGFPMPSVAVTKAGNERQRAEIITRETADRNLRFLSAMTTSAEEFRDLQQRAVREKGVVMPGLADKEVKVVEVSRHPFSGTGKEALQKAEEWANKNIAREHKAIDSSGKEFKYLISSGTVEKYVSKSATDKSDNIGVHLATMMKLPEIISNSVEAEVHPSYNKNEKGERKPENGYNSDEMVHRFYGAALIEGKLHRVKTTMIESGINNPTTAHSFEVTKIEVLAAETSTSDGASPSHDGKTRTAKLLKGVEKSYDSGKFLLDESEKNSDSPNLRFRDSENQPSEPQSSAAKTYDTYDTYDTYITSKTSNPDTPTPREAQAATPVLDLAVRDTQTRLDAAKDPAERQALQQELDQLAEEQDAYATGRAPQTPQQRTRNRSAAETAARALGEQITMHTAARDITHPQTPLQQRMRRAKGWYDAATGQIHINIFNHADEADVIRTILHESIGHKALRDFYGDRFDRFLDEIYTSAEDPIRRQIAERMGRNGWNVREATEEYMATLAETVDRHGAEHLDTAAQRLWQRTKTAVKRTINRLLQAAGLDTRLSLTDRDLSYLLWRQYRTRVGSRSAATAGALETAETQTRLETLRQDPESFAPELSIEFRDGQAIEVSELKRAQIAKLRNSEPVAVTEDMIPRGVDLNDRKAVKTALKESVRGEVTNEDTNNVISVYKDGINEVTAHGMKVPAHVKSLFAIPEMLRKSIFIGEKSNEKDHTDFDKYQYYVCGMKIDGEDYTAKIVVGVKGENRYYDHRLTQIEKGKLLDSLNGLSDSETVKEAPFNGRKGTTLESLLQVSDSKNIEYRFRDGDREAAPDPATAEETRSRRIFDLMVDMCNRNKDNVEYRDAARKALTGRLATVARSMRLQRDFDRAQLAAVTDTCSKMLGLEILDAKSRADMARVIKTIQKSAGKEDLEDTAYTLLDIASHSQVRMARQSLDDHTRIQGIRVGDDRIQRRAKLDPEGQATAKAFRDHRLLPFVILALACQEILMLTLINV